MSVKVGVVGSRRRNQRSDFYIVRSEMIQCIEKYTKDNIVFVSGGCPKGADNFAEQVAEQFKIPMIIHKPDKNKLDKDLVKRNAKVAYAIINFDRNTLIAEDSDILIACVAHNRKGGTEDTIKKYIKKCKESNMEERIILC